MVAIVAGVDHSLPVSVCGCLGVYLCLCVPEGGHGDGGSVVAPPYGCMDGWLHFGIHVRLPRHVGVES